MIISPYQPFLQHKKQEFAFIRQEAKNLLRFLLSTLLLRVKNAKPQNEKFQLLYE